MNPDTRNILFAVLKAGLSRDESLDTEGFRTLFDASGGRPDWKAVYRLASAQGVLAVAWDGVQRLVDAGALDSGMQPDRNTMLQWVYNVQVIEQRYERQRRSIAELAGFYAGHDIRMMLLKGYGLSLCYPVPEHRPCGDIDIWLYGEQERADELLRREKGIEVREDKHHHTIFFVNGVLVENHYDFLNVHAHISNRGLETVLQELAKSGSAETHVDSGEGQTAVWLPPADFNALFLLRHAAVHYAAVNIGLRHVVDWAMFVAEYGGQVDWVRLERTAVEYNMHRFLYCLNEIAVKCTGLDEELFPKLPHDELAGRVLEDILSPEFSEQPPEGTLWRLNIYKVRRWWANRWKHRIVYREGLLKTFFVQIYSHILKPKSFTY